MTTPPLTKLEYRVRPVTRYIVTRYEEGFDPEIEAGSKTWSGSSHHGEFDTETMAFAVAYALCKNEHERLGWAPGDERVKYPEDPASANAIPA